MRKAIPLGVVDYETLKNQNYFFIDKSKIGRASCRERV